MSDGPLDPEALLDEAFAEVHTHVRLREQGFGPQGEHADKVRALRSLIPTLLPFGGNSYSALRVILDWDHQIPSKGLLLRIYAAYSGHEARRLDTQIRARDQDIESNNLYPEFDLPDYGELDASETYVGAMLPPMDKLEDFRFFANWRKEVRHRAAQRALASVRRLEQFKHAYRQRDNDALGGPVVVGWAPPSLGSCENWAIEVWLLTAFDGQGGQALVFMVDSVTQQVTRVYPTDVHLQ